ncbi:MAG: polysaccharide biosynthesis tyrosine autokinase [Clostridium sp.]|nr:polysaccharide biosynthesis tyrosine autokinase [Prevotella sp.]MCM1429157.1 polysaccharide biosynthesis tyrosine autokinase [Clostridium sp.]
MDDTSKQITNVNDTETVFSLRDFITTCLSKWQWFVCSLILFIGLGIFYVLRQQPVYERTCSVLIKGDNSSSFSDPTGGFGGFNLFGGNKNVENELISLTSPSVVSEVVKRLELNINYNQTGRFHPTTLYHSSNPVNVTFPDLNPQKTTGFTMELQPDNSVCLYDFYAVNEEGDKEEYDDEINTRLSFNLVKTPIGRMGVQPNGGFTGHITEPITIKVTHTGMSGTIEQYCAKIKGDLANQDAEVIDLTIDDVNIERACDILDMVITVYNEFWVEDKNRVAVATSDFISERLNLIERELGNVDDSIAQFKSTNRVPDIENTVRMKFEEASRISDQSIKIRNELAMSSFLRDFLLNPKNNNSVIPVNVIIKDAGAAQAISDYNKLLLQRESLIKNSGANNPVIRDMDVQLTGFREAILNSVNANIGSLQTSLQDMERNANVSDSELSHAPIQAKYLLSIERQQKVKEELYVYLLQKREETELSQTFTAYNTRIITPPYGPSAPISPKKKLILIICFILGVAIPGVAFYVIEATNTKIRSRKDLENLPVPFAGEIPEIKQGGKLSNILKTRKKKREEFEAPKPVVEEGKRDIPNEAFRVVRSNIDFMLGKDAKCPVLMLTSFNPGSGKSFIAYNLGVSFALKHKRVLLIDTDLRHGSLSGYAGSPKKGISNYLTGQYGNWESMVVKGVGASSLDIMPIGHKPPNPAELLENGKLGEMLAEAREHYDLIIMDCPPVNIVVDTQIISEYIDRTIFVVRAGLLERSAVKEIAELYHAKKYKNMSILLNGTESTFSSYSHYGTYEAYESD